MLYWSMEKYIQDKAIANVLLMYINDVEYALLKNKANREKDDTGSVSSETIEEIRNFQEKKIRQN